MRWIAAASLVLICAALPLIAPAAWAQHGAFPDFAVLVVVYLAFVGTPDRAATLGVAIGVAGAALTPEPLGLQAFLLGAIGWIAGHLNRSLFQDRSLVQMAACAVAVLLVRLASAVAASAALPRAEELGGVDFGVVLAAAALAAVATALAAPVAFPLLHGCGALASFERRRSSDV